MFSYHKLLAICQFFHFKIRQNNIECGFTQNRKSLREYLSSSQTFMCPGLSHSQHFDNQHSALPSEEAPLLSAEPTVLSAQRSQLVHLTWLGAESISRQTLCLSLSSQGANVRPLTMVHHTHTTFLFDFFTDEHKFQKIFYFAHIRKKYASHI